MKVTISTLLLVFSFLALNGCSKVTEPQQADIAVFEQFLSENPISSINPSIDIASIYQPGDPLFESVLYIQRNLWAEAKKQLEPMAKNQNPDAKFWLASITWGTGIKNNPIAKKLYMESAEQGNPYAALFFSPKNAICQMYYSSECSEKWVEKAQKLFAEQAKTGNVRAVYYSTILKPDLTHEQYISAIINAAKNHYYYPLVEYSNTIINEENPDKDMENIAAKLLNYARFQNFVPAIESLMDYEGKYDRTNSKLFNQLIEQGMTVGSNAAWKGYQLHSYKSSSLSDTQKYISAKATKYFNGDDFTISITHPPKDKKALIVANKKAQEKADSVKRVIYIDGAHVPEG
ncbi:sel1 repeat family protein [Photobacterium angustum]|uniref:sel1 repeat family protein n=1 Tax=Photobacterium angustum TaxID=661 RepID=UPI0005E53144|nr:sel1 repeat family protein [Photobacterium angustum]KJF99849.1 hypothetical protein UB35_20395 [Photobacterium angustum]KJG15330.1 hypothetical protein UA33_20115 [Photobacterium angustum]KJG27164.1 hypothetical protein UA36_20780 [Photobacterium angustum]PSV61321.1 sel1 repeat family protein [Photobacterium angustum]PSW97739.1 sel1 repeat family protein [Photobacterium angustum]